MRRTILLSLIAMVALLAANDACAQRRGGSGPGFTRGGYGLSHARTFSPSGFGYARARSRFGYAAYASGYGSSPYGYGYASLPYNSDYGYMPYDSGAAYPYPPQPVVFAQPPAPPVTEPAGHPVITEYNWPAPSKASAPASSTASESEPQTFALVLKDGSSLSAISVFASEDGLHYVDPDERHLRISMAKIDRAATLKLNRARNLNLYLPAAD